jgi:UDP-N-acetylglucosamine acyltransferase
MKIHPTAIISEEAKIGSDVEIGPYTVIGPNVEIKEKTRIGAHCLIEGNTKIGSGCQIFTGAVIGSIPQDLKYKGETSFLEIGGNNIIREYVTINPGTSEESKTIIGNNNLIMAYSHIAHDCKIGNNCIIANCGTLAGYVLIEDRAIVGGLVAVHQFCRIGELSMIGGCSKVVQDVPPYSTCDGHPAKVYGINLVGLRRQGIQEEVIKDLKRAFRIIFFSGLSFSSSLKRVQDEIPSHKEIAHLIEFIKSSKRGICR